MAVTPEELRIRISAQNDASKPISEVRSDLAWLGTGAAKTQKAVMGASSGIKGMGRSAGQAGIQVQQLVGQIQGGTNPMLALSQQAADLGFVLGAPLLGAVAGLAASFAMVLLPSLFEAEDSLDDVRKMMEDLNETTSELTKAQLTLRNQMIGDEIDDYREKIEELEASLAKFRTADIEGTLTPNDLRRINEINGYLDTYRQKIDALEKSKTTLGNTNDDEISDLEKLISKLSEEAETLGMSDRAQALYNAEKLKATELDKAIINELYDQIEAHKELQDHIKNSAKAEKMLADMRGEVFMNTYDTDQFDRERMNLKSRYDASKSLLDQTYADKVEHGEAMLELDKWYNSEVSRIETERMDASRTAFQEWRDDYEKNMMSMGDIAMSTAQTFQTSFGQALEDVFMGTKDVDDAFRDMARTILGQVINSLGQMAAQWITNQILAQTLGATATATSVATAAGLGAAWAAPAALASLATMGTNAAPAAASIASTVAFSKTMASFDGGGYTGDGARAGGLDGKGGFMAMLHPNETVVDHTKGQSAEAVTVVQNINVSTGVSQTVRNEIASMMPQIAEASKQAVLDARKRGGNFSAAFGG